jgi:tripartite-type tricarboxylate transporter receptor subunit TctC
MKLARRRFLHLATAAVMLPTTSRLAWGEDYPARPVRLMVPAAAGGGVDIVARLIGQVLSERFGQPFVVENRPGAGSNIGTAAVVHAAPDGYTLLLISSANVTNATLYGELNFNFVRDIEPIAGIMRVPEIVAVNPAVPAETIPAFVAYSKANPGKLNMGSAGIGSPSHLAGELFKMMSGAEIVHVPYRGISLALTDLLGGQVQFMISSIPSMIGYIKAGKLRALGVTTVARSEQLPDVPAVGEFIPGYEATQWYGVGAPSKTPSEIVDKLNKEINASLADPKVKGNLAAADGIALAGPPESFATLINSETEKWAKVIKFAGMKPE